MRKLIALTVFGVLSVTNANAQLTDVPMEEGKYSNNWKSLSQWECPEWFKDAKFGLWAHWGPQCQAESGDWYARFMYYSDSPYDEHRGVHFNPSEYGLKEFCRDWKAQNWDPKAIMKKYKAVGCKYFMALGNHHDNFDLWNSPYQEWNSVNIGPKRDLGAEWAEAAREQGLKFGMSIHASHAWTWLEPSQKYDGNLTKADGAGKWWEGYDPQELYAQNHPHSTGWENSGTIHSQWDWGNGASIPSDAYMTKLQNRCRQMVNTLSPDMIYFDDTVLPFWGCNNQWGQDFLAHYYNHASNLNGGGDADVLVTGKILPDEQKQAMLWDVERGIPDRPRDEYWQTCTCIGDWHYNLNTYRSGSYKSAATVIRMLVDIVSKNGNLLLSVPLRGDGTYDEKEAAVLDGIEAWMKINGESIYGTRVWKECFGEGPLAEAVNEMTAQGFNEGQNYTSADVRYVAKNDTIYGTIMAWPSAGEYTMKAFSPLATSYKGKVAKAELLGHGEVAFTQNAKGLVITVPSTKPNTIAPVFRITFEKDNTDDSTLLQSLIGSLEEMCSELSSQASPVNSGSYNSDKVDALAKAVAKAKSADKEDASAVSAAFAELREAYQDFEKNGVNKGGAFDGVIKSDLTKAVLVEGENFSGTLGGRYGKLDNWTVENYNIDKGSEGVRQGLDNYGGTRGISLGVWSDKNGNKGDLTNARIYRKVTLKPGTYYFGGAYNSLYGCNEKAYLFVSKELCKTDDIPSKSLAYYQVNNGSEGAELYGLYIKIEEETEVYLGWQANLNNGSDTQEFRATKIAFYSIGEVDNSAFLDKVSGYGWQELEGMPSSMDYSQYFFALYDKKNNLPIVAKGASGDKNWSGTYAMFYAENADPNMDNSAVWTLDAYKADGTVANGSDAKYLILGTLKDQNRHFRTEGWSKVVWQTYSDYGKNGYPNDGSRDIAYLTPEYSSTDGFAFKNKTSEAYLGPWADGAFENGAEFSANKSKANASHFSIYAISRTRWMANREELAECSEENPADVSYLITNRSFERYDENRKPLGWKTEGDGEIERGYLSGCDGNLYMNNWQGSGNLSNRSVSQTIDDMPAGRYRLSVYGICEADGAILFANDNSIELKHEGNANVSLDFNINETSALTLGVKLVNYQSNNIKFDNFSLSYIGTPIADAIREAEHSESTKAEIFDLQGRKLSTLHKGVNIVKKGKNVEKVIY